MKIFSSIAAKIWGGYFQTYYPVSMALFTERQQPSHVWHWSPTKINLSLTKSLIVSGLSSLGVQGVPCLPHILADQLTLSQSRGRLCPIDNTPPLRFSNLPTALYKTTIMVKYERSDLACSCV